MNFLHAGATPADAIIHGSSAGALALISQELQRDGRQARRARLETTSPYLEPQPTVTDDFDDPISRCGELCAR
jgi:hypothetical protein